MSKLRYLTPEWLEASEKAFNSDPNFQESLKTFTNKLCYRVEADPDWGLERDILFGSFFESGRLTKLAFFTEAEALKESDFILSAPPQEWKKILRKQNKFVTDFMLGKIKLEHGSKSKILNVAPHADKIVKAITQVEMQFPDEMTAEELAEYRGYVERCRKALSV